MSKLPNIQPPTLAQEKERLRKWHETRRLAAIDPKTERQNRADSDRKRRLDQFEADKAARIQNAETRRKEEAEALEARRMEKARAHLEALDDIEVATENLRKARLRSKKIAALLVMVFIGIPTIIAAVFSAFVVPADFRSSSKFAVSGTAPFVSQNPMFNALPNTGDANMSLAFQLRTQLSAGPHGEFEMQINTTEGIVSLTTTGSTPEYARDRNSEILLNARKLADIKLLIQPEVSDRPVSNTAKNTILTFLVSLAIFSIASIFIQSFRHYARP